MNALADPGVGMRCAFAIGLRTLTLQTGRVFQRDLGLGDEQLAIKVGGAASRALFEYWKARAEATGSASRQALLDEGGQVLFEGDDRHPLLQRLTDDAQVRSLIAAPVLACTVDHLTPATESLRGGRQIAPMLRLMTSDLVLDEPDDFDMADLPALTRLVRGRDCWARACCCPRPPCRRRWSRTVPGLSRRTRGVSASSRRAARRVRRHLLPVDGRVSSAGAGLRRRAGFSRLP